MRETYVPVDASVRGCSRRCSRGWGVARARLSQVRNPARYPAGWFVTNTPLSGITNPVQRLVLSSYRLPASVSSAESFTPASHGVAAVLMESLPPYDTGTWPARPRRFRLGRLVRLENLGGNRWDEI